MNGNVILHKDICKVYFAATFNNHDCSFLIYTIAFKYILFHITLDYFISFVCCLIHSEFDKHTYVKKDDQEEQIYPEEIDF